MKTIFRLYCFAFGILCLNAIFVGAQQTRELRTIEGNYNDTATIAPTIERIKTLKLPAGFSIAKFAEIENPRMLAVASDGTVYVSQRDAGTLTMLKDTNGDGAADVQKVVAEKKQLQKLNLPSGFNRQALLDAMKGHVIAKGETVGTYQRKPDVRDKDQILPKPMK